MIDGPDAQRQLASLPHAVVLLAPGQRIASVNPAAEQFLGQSLRRLNGRTISEALRFDEARLAERLSDSDAPVSARDVAVHVAGIGARRIDVTVAPVVDFPGWQVMAMHEAGGVEGLGSDSGAAGGGILRAPEILAHEIKNPLAGIRGAAQLLDRKVSGTDRALTRLIADEVDRVAKLIDEMQTLSRRTGAELSPCNLHEAIRRASSVLETAAGPRIRIEEEFDPSLPPVLGNADALVQVLINLLANARDACERVEKPRIVVKTRFASGLKLRATPNGDPVRLPIELRVSDNGPGVEPVMRDHIFDPFVTSKKTGQGLGLALVRKLVREMNGRIGYDRDDAGGWTHFRVHLPMASEKAPARKGSARS